MPRCFKEFFTTAVTFSRSPFAARLLFALLKRPVSLLRCPKAACSFATNLALLFKADIMMLEADVTIATTANGTIPIMAHPPVNSSDLTLEEFFDKVIAKNVSKGIKLDFKSIEAFNASKLILDKVRSNVRISSVVFIDRRVHLCRVLRASFHRSPPSNGIPENSAVISVSITDGHAFLSIGNFSQPVVALSLIHI